MGIIFSITGPLESPSGVTTNVMLKAKQTKQSKVNQFVQFQLSQQQALKVKGGGDDDVIIEEDIFD